MSQVTSTFYMMCWGCNRTLPRPYFGEEDYARQIQELMTMGWQRRVFGPGADPWFCSDDCAHNSANAKRAEAWWANKKNKEEVSLYLTIAGSGMLLLVGLAALLVAVFR